MYSSLPVLPVFLNPAGIIVWSEVQMHADRTLNNSDLPHKNPFPVASWSNSWFCVRSLAGIEGLNPGRGHGCLSFVNVVCCLCDWPFTRLEECYRVCVCVCVAECGREVSIMRRPRHARAVDPRGKSPRRNLSDKSWLMWSLRLFR